jgi:hypothetical protein
MSALAHKPAVSIFDFVSAGESWQLSGTLSISPALDV